MIDNFWSPVSRGSHNTFHGSPSHHLNQPYRRSTNQDDVAREFEDEFEFETKNINSRAPVKIVRRSNGQVGTYHDSTIPNMMNPYVYVHSEEIANNDGEKDSSPGWFELDMSGIGLRTITLDIKLYSHLTGLYLNNNRLSSIPDDVLLEMKTLVILDLSSNLLQRVPLTLTQITSLEKLFLRDNRITELPVEMGRLYRLKELKVEGNPLLAPPQGVIQGGLEGLIAYLRDRMPMGPPPPERRFIQYIDPVQHQINDKDKFKVLSYNILAESYASSELYFYCPSWALDWNYRKQGILKEILTYDSDIICLQEVESHQYSEFFEPELAKNGYAGVFSPKSRARTMEDWSTVDGCVIFFKRNKFSLVEEHLMEYQSIAMAKHKELNLDSEVFSRLITKDNIGLAVILQLKGSGENYETISNKIVRQKPKYLLVCNTHIHWNPEHKDVKLIQVNMLVEQIANITSNKTKWFKIPMVVCGDFNSQPDSGPYELLGTGRIKAHHQDLEPFNYSIYTTHGIAHNFQLGSAYAPIGEPPFTNYTGDYVGVLDYLWYSQDTLAVSKVLQPVDEEFVKISRLPNAFMNSDHISLLSEFYFKKHQNSKSM